MQSLDGKIVVITGASRGIGAALARHFAHENTKLVLCSRKKTDVDKVARSLNLPTKNVLTLAIDVSTPSSMTKLVRAAYKKFGRVDLFINNAGVWNKKLITQATVKEFDWMISTNLAAVFYSFKELLPRMKKQGGGQIINISSGAGRVPFPGLSIYCATKSALNMLTAVASLESRNDRIKISVLAPGPVDTSTRKSKTQPADQVTADQVAEAAVALARQDHDAYSWMIDVRPLESKTLIPFV
jgi:NADP-dependent 3-hydroxy acid dehydrogenase YdfG